ncbi:laccase [Hysterangium stoloniferum]|nr:laccase [Hysterangium stoloniferum]
MCSLFIIILLFGIVFARTRYYSFEIADGLVSPDGFQRSAVTVNNITPGPCITAQKGDSIMVNVSNRLADPLMRRSTTVHWHGIYQKKRAQDDGPAGVTQCPIAPKNSYSYLLDLGEQAGTFWYHSHLSTQYIDGLRGPLIIYDPHDPHKHLYDVDDQSTIITLTDWYHEYSEQLAADWMGALITEPVPDSVLLNGIGRYEQGPSIERAVVNVERGKRYRLRIINMSAIVPFRLAIEGHYFTIIEADGVNHQPLTATSLSISAGQRYSAVLKADQPIANYWIAYPSLFLGNSTTTANSNYNGSDAWAILRYKGAPYREPTTPALTLYNSGIPGLSGALQEYQLIPLKKQTPPSQITPDVIVTLNFTTTRPGDSSTLGYISPTLPTLLKILSGGHTNATSFSRSQATYILPLNKTIEVRLLGDAAHPFHLHGHTFSVIQSATGPQNLLNPPIRDTVDTSNDRLNPVTIRFRTDNPGPWPYRSHKDWHLEAGLAVVFAEDPEHQRKGPNAIHPSQEWSQLCPNWYSLPKEVRMHFISFPNYI